MTHSNLVCDRGENIPDSWIHDCWWMLFWVHILILVYSLLCSKCRVVGLLEYRVESELEHTGYKLVMHEIIIQHAYSLSAGQIIVLFTNIIISTNVQTWTGKIFRFGHEFPKLGVFLWQGNRFHSETCVLSHVLIYEYCTQCYCNDDWMSQT